MSKTVAALLSLLAVASALAPSASHAQAWPARPVTLVVTTPPGGTNDIVARMYADKIAQEIGQPVVVENRAGAGGNIGTAYVARSAPDGYTFLLQSQAGHTSVPMLMKDPGWVHSDFKPVAAAFVAPYVVVATKAGLPESASTLKGFVDYAKAHPGKLSYASIGTGTLPHIGGLMFNAATGLDLAHIPYKGSGPATIDLLSGQVQLFVVTAAPVVSHIKSGKLAALAVASPERLAFLPDVPTTAELGYPGVVLQTWMAFIAPKGTPDAIITKMNTAVRKVAATDDVRKKAFDLGGGLVDWTPAQLGGVMDKDVVEMAKMIKDNSIIGDN